MIRDTYEVAEITKDTIIIDGIEYPVVKGKHCMWVPDTNMKLIWAYNGKIESYRSWDRGRNREALLKQTFNDDCMGWSATTMYSIANEYKIFSELAKMNFSPPIEGVFYVKNIISDFIYDSTHCDCMGLYGYYISDANKLDKGSFSINTFMKKFVDKKLIHCSTGAIGDLEKENNIINGYLIDIRRTIWDMMVWEKTSDLIDIAISFMYMENENKLKESIKKLTQFPYGQRKQNYQSYYLIGDKYQEGSRDTLYRFEKMGIDKELKGKSILDLGCCLGSMCSEGYRRGARHISGLDYEYDYVKCARDLARYNSMQINFLQKDLTKIDDTVSFVDSYYKEEPIDIIFALSLYKHIGSCLWGILKRIRWKICYIESNNSPNGIDDGQGKKMDDELKRQTNWGVKYIGLTEDRSPRCVWKVTNNDYI